MLASAAMFLFMIQADRAPDQASRRPPNILVIIADDMGFSDAGCYGGEIETPNLDRLAYGGLRFTQCYSSARCWPSRTAILTGYYPQQVRMDPPRGRLPAWARCMPHHLRVLGYRSYHSGKWHVPGAPKIVEEGGFDRSYVINDHDRNFGPKNHAEDDKKLPPVPPNSGYYSSTAIADHAIRCLKEHAAEHAGRPFFSYVAFIVPHFPLQAPQEDIDRYAGRYAEGWDSCRERRWKRLREAGIVNCALPRLDADVVPGWNLKAEELAAQIGPGEAARAVPWDTLTDEQKRFQAAKMAIHAAMIYRMDREIGRILEQVKAMGAYEDTIVLFVSDNGASAEQIIRGDKHDRAAPPGSARSFLCLGPGWSTASNSPFRLHKSWVHEGGIASPLIVHWPAGIKARGELRRVPCHFVDFLPTILELASGGRGRPAEGGTAGPPPAGISLVAAFREDKILPRDFIYFNHVGNRAIRVGDWKLVSAGKTGQWELYDMATDRCEMNDLARRHPEKVRDLSDKWVRLDEEFRIQAGPADGPGGRKGDR